MESLADELLSVVRIAERLREIGESTASMKPAPDKWSKKEIIGHLLDSAANNHQRFVRLQLAPLVELPGYDQDRWVALQRYQDRSWKDLIDFWVSYNTHLALMIRHMDPKSLQNHWRKPDGQEVDLEYIARDYLAHMQHHLHQILPH